MTTTHSINLSGHEVRAALRRELGLVVRPFAHKTMCLCSHPLADHVDVAGHTALGARGWYICHDKCPLGVPGDRLWAKEKFASDGVAIWYASDCDGGPAYEDCGYPDGSEFHGSWSSPALMSRRQSRITLEVEEVRCRLVQDLTVEDIIACGFSTQLREHEACCHLKEQFRDEWSHRYGKHYPWESSPWAWAVGVKRVGECM